jgi:uncharacterized membrane protein YhaH (DUF805 family)
MNIHISKNGQSLGQFSLADINRMLLSGQISSEDMAWHEGLSSWVSVGSVPGVDIYRAVVPQQLPSAGKTIRRGRNPFLWFWFSLQNYTSFAGRARRREWWSFWFLHNIPYIPLILVSAAIDSSPEVEMTEAQALAFFPIVAFTIVYALAMIVPFLALTTRRMHDIGLSAWWWIAICVPCAGGLVMTVFALIPGESGPNRFGSPSETKR